MQFKRIKVFPCLILLVFFIQAKAQINTSTEKHVLYINSYALTYSWGDSVATGVMDVISKRKDITLYVEHLDTKRFGRKHFDLYYSLVKEKYREISWNSIIVSDNNALEFVMKYPDLFKNIPIIFCGINNPEDYALDSLPIYGIKEGVDLNSVIELVLKVIPDIQKLYFINDSTTTSLVNLAYVKELAPNYSNRVKFVYLTGLALDSIYSEIQKIEQGNAIALVNVFQKTDGTPINPDVFLDSVTVLSTVPVFMDSETSFGNGLAGGIINSGSMNGRDAAKLALHFIDNPNYKPELKVKKVSDNYCFDYSVLKKYDINASLLPEDSIIINNPKDDWKEFLRIFLLFAGFILIQFIIIWVLVRNIRSRRKAEKELSEKYIQIQNQNTELEEANQSVQEMYNKVEESNTYLQQTITELEDAKNKAEESERLKTSFLANMSHEIRTPLNSIVGFSDLLKDPTTENEERERYAEIIETNSNQLLRLISDILDLSKSEAGELKLYYKPCNLNKALNEVIEIYTPAFKDTKVKIILEDELHDPNIEVLTDPVRLNQIIGNYLTNAVKFTDVGTIKVGYHILDTLIIFYVRDSGIGIPEELQERIFDRFWKQDNKNDQLNPGTGLGLAICKILAEALGGRVWVDSELGKGSTFYFEHPFNIEQQHPDKKSGKGGASNLYNWEGVTIAIVEDENYNLLYINQILKRTKATTLIFRNGLEIVNHFNQTDCVIPRVILMDIKMPNMDGYEATRIIKSTHPDIPIIAVTAFAFKEDLMRIKEAQFSDYLSKPITPINLLHKINKLLFTE